MEHVKLVFLITLYTYVRMYKFNLSLHIDLVTYIPSRYIMHVYNWLEL